MFSFSARVVVLIDNFDNCGLHKLANAWQIRKIANKVGTFRLLTDYSVPIPCCPLLEESQAFKHGRLSRGNFPAPIFAIVDHFVVNNWQNFGNWKLESLAPSVPSQIQCSCCFENALTTNSGSWKTIDNAQYFFSNC